MMQDNIKRALFVFLAVHFVLCRPTDEIRVIRVIDGDTIVIEGDERVRYIGIDSPEMARGGKRGESLADEAREMNLRLVANTKVRLEFDKQKRDKYGRILAYVYIGDRMVNEVLLRKGLARAVSYPPNTRYQKRFERIEAEARKEGVGIWMSKDRLP